MFVKNQYLTKVLTFFIKINNIYNYFSVKNGCMFDSFTLLYVWMLNWPNRQENRLTIRNISLIFYTHFNRCFILILTLQRFRLFTDNQSIKRKPGTSSETGQKKKKRWLVENIYVIAVCELVYKPEARVE